MVCFIDYFLGILHGYGVEDEDAEEQWILKVGCQIRPSEHGQLIDAVSCSTAKAPDIVSHWKGERKRSALPQLAFRPDPPTMSFNDTFSDR